MLVTAAAGTLATADDVDTRLAFELEAKGGSPYTWVA